MKIPIEKQSRGTYASLMSAFTYSTEGVILKSTDFQDFDKILTVFSGDLGIIKLIVKRGYSKQLPAHLTSPMTEAEFIFTKGKSDLLKCREISLCCVYPKIREKLEYLEASCDIMQVLLESQHEQTPAPKLYALFKHSLDKIPIIENAALLALSFRLKLLRHEGYLALSNVCAGCQAELEEQHLNEGASFCAAHAGPSSFAFTSEESASLLILTYCQNYKQLESIDVTDTFKHKIMQLFASLIH